MKSKNIEKYFFFDILSTITVTIILIPLMISCSTNLIQSDNLSQSKEAKNALDKLKRLNSDIEVGINKIDYAQEVKELKFDVEQVDEAKLSQNNTEFTNHLNSATEGHLIALELWEHGLIGTCRADSRYEKEPPSLCTKWEDSEILSKAINKYPEIRTLVDDLAKGYFDRLIKNDTYRAKSPEDLIFYSSVFPEINEDISNKIIQVIWQHNKTEATQVSTAMLK